MYAIGFTSVLICLLNGIASNGVEQESREDDVSQPAVQHTILRMELPKPVSDAIPREPSELCRILQRELGPSIRCDGINWETESSGEVKNPAVELESLRALVTSHQSAEQQAPDASSVSSVVQLTILIENPTSTPINNAVFGGPYSPVFDGRGESVCDAIKQSIQSRWSRLCATGIVCSGAFRERTANLLHFPVLLYYPPHKLVHCPDFRKPETLNTLMGVLDKWIFGNKVERIRMRLARTTPGTTPGITYDIKIENVTAATNNAVFGGPYSAIFAGQVGGVCDAIKQSIQSKWSQLCSTGIVCSGRFLNEMANKLHFSVVLYSSSHKLIHCPHLRKPETFNTLMGVMDERIFGKRIEGTRVTLEHNEVKQMKIALLKLKLNRDDWSELPVAGSELYQSTKAEVSHQLTQIMRISKVQGTECNFEFSGFAQDDDGAVAAFALLFFDPLKITLPSVVQQLQNGLAAIRSLKLTDKQIDGLDYAENGMKTVWTPKMKFATTQPNPALPEKTRSEQELNSLIKMFMHLGTRRCPLWNAIDKTEHTIVHHSPILINLICRITVDRTKLVMDLKATANLFTQCLEHGLTAERKNWQMLSSLDAVSQW